MGSYVTYLCFDTNWCWACNAHSNCTHLTPAFIPLPLSISCLVVGTHLICETHLADCFLAWEPHQTPSVRRKSMMMLWQGNTFHIFWLFVGGIHWCPVDSSHKGPEMWCSIFALLLSWTIWWTNCWVAGDFGHMMLMWFHCKNFTKFCDNDAFNLPFETIYSSDSRTFKYVHSILC